jgi:hypothetical protein
MPTCRLASPRCCALATAVGGTFETEANAFYLEDIWNITPNLMLNLGVRWDRFENRTAAGKAFIKMDDLIAPRVGFSWDMRGDGSTKLFGNAGRYYLPVTNNINVNFAGGLTDEYSYYVLNGWEQKTSPTGSPYMAPIVGQQIGPTDTRMNTGGADLRQSVDRDLKAVYQDEHPGLPEHDQPGLVVGVNATYRRMTRALDDIRINYTPCGPTPSTLWPIANPGESLTSGATRASAAPTKAGSPSTPPTAATKDGSGEVIGYSSPSAPTRRWSSRSTVPGTRSGCSTRPTCGLRARQLRRAGELRYQLRRYRHGAVLGPSGHQRALWRAVQRLPPPVQAACRVCAEQAVVVRHHPAGAVRWPDHRLRRDVAERLHRRWQLQRSSGGGTGWLCVANCSGPTTSASSCTAHAVRLVACRGPGPWTPT